jgi:uncharacterized Zn-finger protein
MTLSFSSLLRHRAGPCLLALCLTACAVEPKGFWTDTPKGEAELTEVLPPPVARKPGHAVGLNVTFLPGYVRSPFTHPPRLVDVRGLRPGSLVVCPFTQKLFNLPADFVDASPRSRLPAAPVYHLQREPTHQSSSVPPLTPAAAPAARDRVLPDAIAVPGRPGFVYSPYADKDHLVDVSGLAAGMEVKCPYTGKLFRVPVEKR